MALLTVNIPIYNRPNYLVRMLELFMRDKSLFDNPISLFAFLKAGSRLPCVKNIDMREDFVF